MGRLSVQQIKSPKQAAKAKMKKPVKVVYISNPMRVTTSAARFRGLVQKLTGRDSNVADMDATNSPMVLDDGAAAAAEPSPDSAPGSGVAACDYGGGMMARRDPSPDSDGVDPYTMFNDAFAPQMLENFPGLYYEPQAGGFWRLGEV